MNVVQAALRGARAAQGGAAVTAYAYTGGKDFDATLPTIVFVHGALGDHSVWTLAARWFAHHGHGVLALDLPGHGRSSGPALASIEAMADWLLTVLDDAARAPARARHLVMIGTAYPMVVSPALLAAAENDPQGAIESVNLWSHSTSAAKPSHPGPGAWLRGGSSALMRSTVLITLASG